MPTLLDHLDTDPVSSHGIAVTTGAAQRLRTTMAACRVSFTWWGVQRTLTSEQKAQAAQAFDAEGEFLSAGKKLLDTKHTAFRAVTAIRTKIGDYWKGLSLPFPEPGVRLIKLESVEDVRPPDGRLSRRIGRRGRQPRSPFRRAEAGGGPPVGLALQSVGLPGDVDRPLRRLLRLPLDRAAGLPGPARARALRARAGAGPGPVRGGRSAGRAGVRRRVRPPGQPSHGANLGHQRGRDAQGVSRHRRGQSRRLLRAFPLVERPVQPAARRPGGPGPAGRTKCGAQDLRDSEAIRSQVATQLSRVQSSLDAMLVDRPRRRILRNTPAAESES